MEHTDVAETIATEEKYEERARLATRKLADTAEPYAEGACAHAARLPSERL